MGSTRYASSTGTPTGNGMIERCGTRDEFGHSSVATEADPTDETELASVVVAAEALKALLAWRNRLDCDASTVVELPPFHARASLARDPA